MLMPGIALSLLTGLEVVLYSSAGIVAPIIVGLAGAHARNLDNNGGVLFTGCVSHDTQPGHHS